MKEVSNLSQEHIPGCQKAESSSNADDPNQGYGGKKTGNNPNAGPTAETVGELQPASKAPRSSRMGNHKMKIEKSERKILKTLFVVSVSFFICWVGKQVLFFILVFVPELKKYVFTVNNFVISMAFLNSVINPFIYVITLKEYRHKLFEKIRGR